MLNRVLIIVLVVLCVSCSGVALASADAVKGQALSDLCVDCHGDDGLGDDEVPAIAGMDEAAMRKELGDFKSGARVDEYEDMAETAADRSEQDIKDLAAFYSALSK